MADHSKAQDPNRMAQLELSAAYGSDTVGMPAAAYHLARAQVFATLAVAEAAAEQTKWIREVADQLDTLPRQGLVDAVRALADQQVQVTVEHGEAFALRGIAVRPTGGAA